MEIKYPDYDRSLLSLSSSILKYFGVKDCKHKSLPELDSLLQKQPKNVVVMLFDGLGSSLLDWHLPQSAFLRQHKLCDISSVFPPTTTAATTTVQSGYSPFEHSWLGWDLYFSELDENVTAFRNKLQKDGSKAASYNVAQKYIPYKSIFDRISEADGTVGVHYLSMFSSEKVFTVRSAMKKILKISRQPGRQYIYLYWYQPDHAMHQNGVKDKKITSMVDKINKRVEKLSSQLTDTVAVAIADHGLVDVEWAYLEDYPELSDMLLRAPSIEPRALSLFVKPDKKDDFKKLFNETFGEKFLLFTKEEVYEKQLFGPGEIGKKTDDFIGDFLAVATDNLCIGRSRPKKSALIGNHAGLTKEEMTIPFIVVKDKK